MTKHIGILTAGGDSPGLNAAIRGAGKAGELNHDMRIIGFKDGFRGLVENRTMSLDGSALSGILTVGGTILGTPAQSLGQQLLDGEYVQLRRAARGTGTAWTRSPRRRRRQPSSRCRSPCRNPPR